VTTRPLFLCWALSLAVSPFKNFNRKISNYLRRIRKREVTTSIFFSYFSSLPPLSLPYKKNKICKFYLNGIAGGFRAASMALYRRQRFCIAWPWNCRSPICPVHPSPCHTSLSLFALDMLQQFLLHCSNHGDHCC
jgi:hypothetical protein